MRKPFLPWVLCAAIGIVACGGDDEDNGGGGTVAPCNERGGECPSGQVCWPNASQSAFECLNAAAGVGEGSTCVNTVGTPTCDEGLACVMLQGQSSGSCMKYCDPKIAGKGCDAGEVCTQMVMTGIGSAYVCVGTTPQPDAGADDASTPPPDDGGTESGADDAAADG